MTPPNADRPINEQAAEWFILVREANPDSDVHVKWLAWIEANPAHRRAFTEIRQAWDFAEECRPLRQHWFIERERFDFERRRKIRRSTLIATAACLVLGVSVTLWNQRWSAATPAARSPNLASLSTAKGEARSAWLPDGSRVELQGETAVELEFTREKRLVKAAEGEVFYRVSHDPKRPFIVESGPVSVTAIGTAFFVRREGSEVSVLVTDGVVTVDVVNGVATEHVTAKAGERVRFDQGRLLRVVHSAQVLGNPTRHHKLLFEDEPLRVVVASLNRYYQKKIIVDDSDLRELHFTGTVYDDSIEDWLTAITTLFPIAVKASDDAVLLEKQ